MNKYKISILAVAGLAVLVAGFFIYRSVVYRTEISEFELTASASDVAGIAPDSRFILKTTAPLTAQVIEKYLKFYPAVDVDIKKVLAQDNTFEIVPKAELAPNTVYTILMEKGPLAGRDFSWAYQVKAPFQAVSSIPKDTAVIVPLNTGIEIDFNRDDIIDPEKFIFIFPFVQGKYEVVQNKVRFIPKNPLSEKTIYTVTIKSGLKAKGVEDVFADDKVIRFETQQDYESKGQPYASFNSEFDEFAPESDIVLGVYAYNIPMVSTAVYRFDSAQDFIDSVGKAKNDAPWAQYYKNTDVAFPESKKIFSGSLPTEVADRFSFIRLPETLSVGYYAAVIDSGKNKDIEWFQVNPVASFAAFASSKSLLWLKDISTGKSVANASLTFNGKDIGKTASDGVVNFATPSELIKKPSDTYYTSSRKFLTVRMPTGDLVIPTEGEYGGAVSIEKRDGWWDYISLNKNTYLPTDTLRFWAIQKPRQGEMQNSDISVKLTNAYWSESEENITTYAETAMEPSEFSTLTGELSFANLKPGVYYLVFRQGDETIAMQMVTVTAYIKPAYKIALTPNKTAIFAGESVTFNAKAEFFDGTPVADIALSYSTYGLSDDSRKGIVRMDSRGEGSFTLASEYSDNRNYWPSHLSVSVSPQQSEEGQMQADSLVVVFGPHIYNSITQKQSDSSFDFTVKTRAVVINNPALGRPYWDTEEYLGSPISGASTQVAVSELVFIKNQTGTGYDPINKLTYPIYDYKTEDRPISSHTILADQNGSAQFSFVPENKKTYKFVFTTYDSLGRAVVETRHVYGGLDDVGFGLDNSYYTLNNPDNKKDYKVGEPISLQLQTFESLVPPERENGYMFMTVTNGNIEYKIQSTPRYSGVFKSENIPNVGIWPGWFDGRRFRNAYVSNLSFDANERRLSIAVKKDKQSYKPGDTVTLDIRVTDNNGGPVKAELNISALDEAVFSMDPTEKDIVGDLYKDIFSQVVIRTSNTPPYGGGGAEKGGGEGDGPRSDIQEMAVFKSVVTDASGYARVQFKLPDNITSWRLTSQAITKDLSAGKDVSFIPVTLPVFVDATLNKTYLSGDELMLRLRTFGTLANQGTAIYSVKSETLPFKKIERAGGNNIEVPLGKLPFGRHNLTVQTKVGGFSDALTRTLNVVDSYFAKNTSDFYEGAGELKIKNDAVGYTTLAFSSLGKGSLYSELKNLSYQWGSRLDQKGSEIIVADLLKAYFGEENEKPDFNATAYQAYSGGLQLLPYSDEDLELSAIASHLFGKDVFDKTQLKAYFYDSLRNKKSDVSRSARALYGLTSFGEPVLTRIQSLKNDSALTPKDRIFIALALDSLGAKEDARAYYKKMIAPSLQIEKSYAYVDDLKGDEAITATALTAVLTARLDEPISSQLALYAGENLPRETLTSFERLLYIKSALPKLDSEEIGFAYQAGSKQGEKTLKNGETFKLILSPQELDAFKLSKVKGRLGIVSSYEKRSSPNSIVQDKNLSLSRSYEVAGATKTQFDEGDMVLVRLSPKFLANALGGAYQIVDHVPSGLRPIDHLAGAGYRYEKGYGARIYPIEINNQKVTFVVDKKNTMPIYYYARVVSKGVYKAEPALIQSLKNPESATISNEASIAIK